tara:strand:+ start:209 stop:424 length:216 start_codon:yes stop_codon:yes gene_type:complete
MLYCSKTCVKRKFENIYIFIDGFVIKPVIFAAAKAISSYKFGSKFKVESSKFNWILRFENLRFQPKAVFGV